MSEYVFYNELSKQFLEKDYLLPGQTLDQRVSLIANRAEEILGISGFANKFKDYMKRGWYSLASPVWANYGTDRALPISCFNSHVSDSVESIMDNASEIAYMSKIGGGTSAYFGDVRHRGSNISTGGETNGPVNFMRIFDTLINVISQGSVRRGSCAVYLPVEHPDIMEFLEIKSEGNPIQNLSFGVTVTNAWLDEMIDGDQAKRTIWAKIIEKRTFTGYPYIVFIDNANKQAPDVYKELGRKIKSSNLCSEIMLSSNEDESFVCCLSSMNIEKYDEWKDTDAVETMIYFLDTVMEEFIIKSRDMPFMGRAYSFAVNQRALGLGWLGWHSYLQSKMVAFESFEAKRLNVEIAQNIQSKALEASKKMAKEFGKPLMLQNYDRRHVTLMAIAPTKSSSFILQTSEGVEPINSNYYVRDLAKGKFSIRNKFLEKLLEERNLNDTETWKSILLSGGSVQHLENLSPEEKDVFKTFYEISPQEILIQASVRQKYVDQGQSINLAIDPSTPAKDINSLYLRARDLGIKALYYQIGINAAQKFSRNIVSCSSCEG